MRDESGGARHEIAISCFVISILRRSSALRGPDLGPAIFFISHISHMEKFHVESPPLEITSLLPLPSTPPCPEKPFSSSPGSGNGCQWTSDGSTSSAIFIFIFIFHASGRQGQGQGCVGVGVGCVGVGLLALGTWDSKIEVCGCGCCSKLLSALTAPAPFSFSD